MDFVEVKQRLRLRWFRWEATRVYIGVASLKRVRADFPLFYGALE